MSKKNKTVRISEATQAQIDSLSKFGGASDVIAIAIDRLYHQEEKE